MADEATTVQEEDHSKDGMIALLPTTSEWCKQELPHMTVVYLGDIELLDIDAYSRLCKRAGAVAQVCSSISTKVMGTEILGDEEKVNTLKLEPTPQLLAIREFFDEWDESEFDFHPHCTIGPADGLSPEFVPMCLVFDRIMLGWGDDVITFNLRTY